MPVLRAADKPVQRSHPLRLVEKERPDKLRRHCRNVAAALLTLLLAPAAQAVEPIGVEVPPLPLVEGPIPVTADSHPWNAAAFTLTPIDLKRRRYIEEEFFVSGTARVYDWPAVGALEAFTEGPYKTRILVRRPRNPRSFSGTVIVNLMNPSSDYDVDIMWEASHESFLRRGDIWVGISVKPVVIDSLQVFDPARYGSLSMANPLPPDQTCDSPSFQNRVGTEAGLAWDIVSQVGALLKSRDRDNPLRRYQHRIKSSILTGFSQTGGYTVVYLNAIAPHFELFNGEPIFDGYLNAAGAGFQPPIHQCAGAGPQTVIDPPGDAPVISVQTESDFNGPFFGPGLPWRRDDSDEPGDRFRLYEVPGSAHIWAGHRAFTPASEDLIAAGEPGNDWATFCVQENTDFPLEYVFNAAFANLSKWIERGKPPPRTERIALDADQQTITDEFGNAVGGLRTPYLDVPIANYRPTSDEITPFTTSCPFFWGHKVAFDQGQLDELYRNRADYLRKVIRSTWKLVHKRVLLPKDGRLIIREAIRARVP